MPLLYWPLAFWHKNGKTQGVGGGKLCVCDIYSYTPSSCGRVNNLDLRCLYEAGKMFKDAELNTYI